jgi:hypothetical protein
MPSDITSLERRLESKNKEARLKTLGLILRHPDATPIQLVRCLCSEDNRNFECLKEPGLLDAIHEAWPRLHGVEDPGVYRYLSELYRSDPGKHLRVVVHVLWVLRSRPALEMLDRLRESPLAKPDKGDNWIDDARKFISHRLGPKTG